MRPHNNKLIGLACGRASSDCGERLLARDSFARDSLLATPCSQPPCCHHVLAIYSSFVPSQPPPPPSFARKASCTKAKPCTPCEIDHMVPFGDRWTRCQSCSAGPQLQIRGKLPDHFCCIRFLAIKMWTRLFCWQCWVGGAACKRDRPKRAHL